MKTSTGKKKKPHLVPFYPPAKCFLGFIFVFAFLTSFNNETRAQLRIQNGTSLVNKGSITVKDIGIINNGTFSNSQGTITFSGADNSLIGGSGESVFNNVTINKSVNTAKVFMNGNITLNGTLTMTSGDLDVYDKILTLGSTALISGETNGNLIYSSFTNGSRGYITTTRNFLSPLSSETFGNIGIALTTAAATGNITVNRMLNAAEIDSYTGISKQFSITPANNSGLNASLDLKYFAAECTGLDPSGLEGYLSTNTGSTWEKTAAINSYNPGTLSGTLTISGLESFPLNNFWTASDEEHPLPVKLTSFTGNRKDRDVTLKWITESEINNAGFEVQRSRTGIQVQNWEKVGFVKGSGTKNEPTSYSFNDIRLNSGKYTYRLKQSDLNGNTEYFILEKAIEIELPNSFNLGQNYPNPFNPGTRVDFQVPKSSAVSIRIFDLSGRELRTLINETKEPGFYTVSFEALNISSGIYFYRMTAGTYSKTLKMTVLK